jgi:hypothetical protein
MSVGLGPWPGRLGSFTLVSLMPILGRWPTERLRTLWPAAFREAAVGLGRRAGGGGRAQRLSGGQHDYREGGYPRALIVASGLLRVYMASPEGRRRWMFPGAVVPETSYLPSGADLRWLRDASGLQARRASSALRTAAAACDRYARAIGVSLIEPDRRSSSATRAPPASTAPMLDEHPEEWRACLHSGSGGRVGRCCCSVLGVCESGTQSNTAHPEGQRERPDEAPATGVFRSARVPRSTPVRARSPDDHGANSDPRCGTDEEISP